jgi:hypothetical protein
MSTTKFAGETTELTPSKPTLQLHINQKDIVGIMFSMRQRHDSARASLTTSSYDEKQENIVNGAFGFCRYGSNWPDSLVRYRQSMLSR